MGEASRKEKTKKEQFDEDPNRFIDGAECLMVVKRTPDGKGYMVMNNCRNLEDVFMAKGFADEAFQNRRDQIRMIAIKQKQAGGIIPATPAQTSRIVTPGGNGRHG